MQRCLGRIETWRCDRAPEEDTPQSKEGERSYLPLLVRRGGRLQLVDGPLRAQAGDELVVVVFEETRGKATAELEAGGWSLATADDSSTA